MKVALVQSTLSWENPEENRSQFTAKINALESDIDLIVLPEMFSSGFTMNPATVAETMTGTTIQWIQQLAKTRQCALTGSLVIKENNHFYNRLVFVFPSGELQFYDKRHLFTLAGEEKIYTAGKEKLLVTYKNWKICLLVCYDLRFPVFSRNVEQYDLLIYVANWPESRILAWDSLLRARAIENICYTLGVNRTGTDDNGMLYNGHSQLIGPTGEYLISPQEATAVFTATLSQETITQTRQRFNFLNDADRFEILD